MAVWRRDGEPDATFPFADARGALERLQQHGGAIAVVSDIHYDIRDHSHRAMS